MSRKEFPLSALLPKAATSPSQLDDVTVQNKKQLFNEFAADVVGVRAFCVCVSECV